MTLSSAAHTFAPDADVTVGTRGSAPHLARSPFCGAVLPTRESEGQPGSRVLDREALYGQFTPLVRRLIRQYGETAEMRQDLAGEIYYRFCALLEAYDPARGVPLRAYLVRQLTATIYTYARQQWSVSNREVGLECEDNAKEEATVDPTQEWVHSLWQKQVAASLPEALDRLPRRQRQVLVWRYYESRSFEEIAEILNIQPATARSLLRHGLNNLRKHIAGEPH